VIRRVLILFAVLAAAALGTGLAVTGSGAAAPQPPAEEEEEGVLEFEEDLEGVDFHLIAEGFEISVIVTENDGDVTASMSVTRDGILAAYLVPATLTDHSVAAKFGSLGEFNLAFDPKKAAGKCRRLLFTGSFTFAGENGYVHVDADHARGSFAEQTYFGCVFGSNAGSATFVKGTGFHLEALAGSWKHGTARRVLVDEYRRRNGRRGESIYGFQREEREGMIFGRGATATGDATAFRRNLKAGTATLTPPAPFTGSATLRPGPGGKGIWEGSLQLPVLDGGEPIVFTGPQFKASLEKREPEIAE
jgi:hypothetical protein